MLILKLEKSESQINQFAKKLNEVTTKKTTVASQHKRDLSDQRSHYECRLKKQQSEYQALRRKHMQLISKSDTYKNQQRSSMDQLDRKIEKLSHEKKKLLKRIKQESDRSKEKINSCDNEISKLKRQESQLLIAKKKAEREAGAQRTAYKRAAEEIVAMSAQMKQIATILKKVMAHSNRKNNSASNNVTYHNLLAKAAACANVRGYLINKSMTKKPVTVGTGKLKAATLQQHVFQKKKMIHKAIQLYIQRSPSTSKAIEELVQKRTRLIKEQQELLSERNIVLKEQGDSEMDLSTPQYMDERIDLITLHLDTLNKQISELSEKEVDNSDDSEWTDIINNKGKDFQLGISNITDSQVAYEIALSLIRSLEPEEARLIAESLVEDIIQLKYEHQYHSISLRHLNSTLQSFQTGLVQMRRVRELRLPFQNNEQTSDIVSQDKHHYELYDKLISHLDSTFIKMLHRPVYLEHGLILPKDDENLSAVKRKSKRLTITTPVTPTAPSIKSPVQSSNLKESNFKSCLPIFSGSSRVAVSRAESAPSLLLRLTESQ
jgi:myosin heavy subunit